MLPELCHHRLKYVDHMIITLTLTLPSPLLLPPPPPIHPLALALVRLADQRKARWWCKHPRGTWWLPRGDL